MTYDDNNQLELDAARIEFEAEYAEYLERSALERALQEDEDGARFFCPIFFGPSVPVRTAFDLRP